MASFPISTSSCFTSHEIGASVVYGAETIVRGRILSLVKYLESIQQ